MLRSALLGTWLALLAGVVLAEFDALPGIGNEAVPRLEPRRDGGKDGQGCGHPLFGAGSLGAGLALKRVMQALGLRGTLKVFGTPAAPRASSSSRIASATSSTRLNFTPSGGSRSSAT